MNSNPEENDDPQHNHEISSQELMEHEELTAGEPIDTDEEADAEDLADDEGHECAEHDEAAAKQAEEQQAVEQEEQLQQQRRRGPEVNSVQELIATLPAWARNHAQLLRGHLTGVVALITTDPHRAYRIDWSGDRLVAEAGEAQNADCRVTLSQADLMRVVRGEFNPQIGMLSGRIKASGNPEMAMYLFNLIVRR
jgi:hypothetical protein